MSKPSKREKERRHQEEMADAILEYLAEHPQASDTLKGIAEWWIMRQQVRVELDTLKEVLRELTESGALEEIGNGDSRRYRLKETNPVKKTDPKPHASKDGTFSNATLNSANQKQ